MSESYHSVVIVGAGVAGLWAAQLLKNQFPDLLVVEAQGRIGGRIKQEYGLVPWAVEAGPEFIHGRYSSVVSLAQKMGAKFEEKEWPDWWYFGKEKKLMPDSEVGPEVAQVHDLFQEQVGDEAHPPPGKDVSAADWLRSKGATEKMISVADACYANDFSASLRQVGLREMIQENKGWTSGETYLQMDRSMGSLIAELSQGVSVRTNCPVTAITYSGSGEDRHAVLQCGGGRTIRCKAVLVTVPLRILQDNVIRFSPALPAEKQAAIRRVKMGNVVKIMLTFSKQFWRGEEYDVLCPDCFVPEFWMLRYPAVDQTPGLAPHCVVGFIAGEKADAISAMPQEQAVSQFLAQLDEIYGTPANPHPASSCLVQSRLVDWSREPWVRGAYTYPSLGAELEDRENLSAPVNDTVFFAGEACNLDLNPCIQGAMDSAQRAAIGIALAVKPAAPKAKL